MKKTVDLLMTLLIVAGVVGYKANAKYLVVDNSKTYTRRNSTGRLSIITRSSLIRRFEERARFSHKMSIFFLLQLL